MIDHRGRESTKDAGDRLSFDLIGAALRVHRELGPGLLESVYESCLCRELCLADLRFERQVSVPVMYRGEALDCGVRLDLLVDGRLVVEIKSVERVHPIH